MIPVLVIHFFIFLFLFNTILANQQPKCDAFDCRVPGKVYPNTTLPECPDWPIDCTTQTPALIDLKGGGRSYQVKTFSHDRTLVIHDPFLQRQLNSKDCSAIINISLPNSLFFSLEFVIRNSSPTVTLLKCSKTLKFGKDGVPDSIHTYEDCGGNQFLYYNYPEPMDFSQFDKNENLSSSCSVLSLPLIDDPASAEKNSYPFSLCIADFYVKWELSNECQECSKSGRHCLTHDDISDAFKCVEAANSNRRREILIGAGVAFGVVGIILSISILIYFMRKKRSLHDSLSSPWFWKDIGKNNHQDLEAFFKTHGSLAPKRYSFKDVKNMTSSFKEKLGQGGYGSVFKGKLNDGRLVAVKVLFNKLKTNNAGVEFINEVASISRTSHVNIVTLLGFCYDKRNKRALIYEFMPNGSLEKFIYGEKLSALEANLAIGWETVFQVAIEIARGLEYLHRGCTTRILHFDIKPHNILLDEGFHAKISDFGLARLCLEKESFISMSGARGTAGYIAPEVFNRNFGGISNKSDVYSYGMVILEMVGGRKNIDVKVGIEHPSQLYFPHRIYDRIKLNEDLGLHGIMTEEREQAAKKMIIVGLWCIQTNPSSRPSMSKVLEMLEGSLDALEIPPKPFLSSPPRSPQPSISSSTSATPYNMEVSA